MCFPFFPPFSVQEGFFFLFISEGNYNREEVDEEVIIARKREQMDGCEKSKRMR